MEKRCFNDISFGNDFSIYQGMPVPGLQTARITWFSENGKDYRKLMNTLTGIFVYGTVVFIAVYSIIKASIHRKRVVTGE